MNVILAATEGELASAWSKHCGHLDGVVVHHGSILEVRCDAVVSPANSFGFMDGGIDLAYSERFGWGVQERLQSAIREHHDGELLVGAAEVVETRDPAIPYLIAAPTMRVPMILRDSVNPYLAARASKRIGFSLPWVFEPTTWLSNWGHRRSSFATCAPGLQTRRLQPTDPFCHAGCVRTQGARSARAQRGVPTLQSLAHR